MSKGKILILAIIFISAVTFIFYAKPTKVSVDLEGIIINKTTENKGEKAVIRFEGYVYRKVFKPSTFRGYIYINDKKYPHVSIEMLKDSYSEILYWSGDENSPTDGVFLSFGKIFIDEDFNSLELRFTSEGVANDKVLVAPANNLEEAENILQQIRIIVLSKYGM